MKKHQYDVLHKFADQHHFLVWNHINNINLFSKIMIYIDIKLINYLNVSCLSDKIICFNENEWIQKLNELVMIIFIFR